MRSSVRPPVAILTALGLLLLGAASQAGAQAGRLGTPERAARSVPSRASVPEAFQADPFSPVFVVIGAEGGMPGEYYFPIAADGTFGQMTAIEGLGDVDGADVADMDRDGDYDFLMCDGTAGEVYLFLNEGDGLFLPVLVASGITRRPFCTNLRVADFNRDGLYDFVVGDLEAFVGVRVFLQEGVGVFAISDVLDTSWADTTTCCPLFGVATGDVDNDGAPDIVLGGYTGDSCGQIWLYPGHGDGRFGDPRMLCSLVEDFGLGEATGIGLLDVDGDSDLDLVLGGLGPGSPSGRHFLYTNTGAGAFERPAAEEFVLEGQSACDAADLDSDGDHDLLVTATWARTLNLAENLGGELAEPVAVGDLTGLAGAVGAPPLALEFGGCNTGVSNRRLGDSSLEIELGHCPLQTRRRGHYVGCIMPVLKQFQKADVITRPEKRAVKRCLMRAWRAERRRAKGA